MKMKVILLSVFLLSNVLTQELKILGLFYVCDRTVTLDYHRGLQEFSTKLIKQVAIQNDYHFAASPYSIWLSLSALAEGSNGSIQKQFFEFLNLPKSQCLREKYYEIATSLESPGNDVTLQRTRLLILDETLMVNDTWVKAVRTSGLIDTKIAPIRSIDFSTNQLPEFKMNGFEINGNSVILDTLDYEGLWTTAFDNSSIEKSNFYNDEGERIGQVDFLKMKKRVRLCYVPFLNAKLLELPVGNNGRYRMLFILNLGNSGIRRIVEKFPSSFIIDSLPLLVESAVPVEVAIPKFKMTTQIDYMKVLENLGMNSIWKDFNTNRYVSQPRPTLTIRQRVTISMDSPGIDPPSPTGAPSLWIPSRRFVANRPFLYGLLDSETRTWLFSGVYSKPAL